MKRIVLKVLELIGIKKRVVNSVHKRRSLKLYGNLIKKHDLVFDIGANIGDRTEIFNQLGARIISVEPQTKCVEILRQRFKNNDNIQIIGKGLADKVGEMELFMSEESSVIASMSEKWRGEGTFSSTYKWEIKETVSVTTLDELINEFGTPVFCKIDVEGFEVNVIKGLTKVISCISFEFTNEFISDAEKCVDLLKKISDIEMNFSLGETMVFYNKEFMSPDKCFVIIKNLNDDLSWGDIYIKPFKA
jgi:FkbM family methyltransferase